jgi:hypothetical protein
MKKVPHPQYSPDLEPSNYYLFGHVKGIIARRSFENKEAFFEAIRLPLDIV